MSFTTHPSQNSQAPQIEEVEEATEIAEAPTEFQSEPQPETAYKAQKADPALDIAQQIQLQLQKLKAVNSDMYEELIAEHAPKVEAGKPKFVKCVSPVKGSSVFGAQKVNVPGALKDVAFPEAERPIGF